MSPKKRDTPHQAIATSVADVTFRLLVACQEKERRAAARFRLTVPEFRTLRVFRGRPELSVKDLLHILGEENSRLSRVLGSLEAKGFLTRVNQPEDRRSVIAVLTGKGRTLVRALEQQYVQMHEEILQDIPGEIHKPLLTGLENLLQAIERWLKEA